MSTYLTVTRSVQADAVPRAVVAAGHAVRRVRLPLESHDALEEEVAAAAPFDAAVVAHRHDHAINQFSSLPDAVVAAARRRPL